MATTATGHFVEILRGNSDCTNDGVTSRARGAVNALLLDPGHETGPFEPSDRIPTLLVIRRWIGTPNEYAHAVPCDKDGVPLAPKGANGPMFGGNFVYSSDGRFRAICQYPIPVHDRFELPND